MHWGMSPTHALLNIISGNKKEENGMGTDKSGYSRRDFLRVAGTASFGLGLSLSRLGVLYAAEKTIIPVSEGYLVVDQKKCAGCYSCMLACSLVHHGEENLSLARIQVVQDPHLPFPGDILLVQCRQCVDPACVEACPADALQPDPENGNVRIVDYDKCIGCQSCVQACPYGPSRAVWNFKANHAQKCDLCAKAPHWGRKGGPAGEQACVSVCPMKAISFTREIPLQEGDKGYYVNLRDETWQKLGFSTQE